MTAFRLLAGAAAAALLASCGGSGDDKRDTDRHTGGHPDRGG
jgi:hypothetical protein